MLGSIGINLSSLLPGYSSWIAQFHLCTRLCSIPQPSFYFITEVREWYPIIVIYVWNIIVMYSHIRSRRLRSCGENKSKLKFLFLLAKSALVGRESNLPVLPGLSMTYICSASAEFVFCRTTTLPKNWHSNPKISFSSIRKLQLRTVVK